MAKLRCGEAHVSFVEPQRPNGVQMRLGDSKLVDGTSMKTYAYLRLVSNEVGRVHRVSLNFQAKSLGDAVKICRKRGWDFDGEVIEVIPAPVMNKALSQRRRTLTICSMD